MVVRNVGSARGLAVVRDNAPLQGGATASESGTRRVTARPRRVLLVEDEDMVRKVVGRMLSSRGFEVHAAANGTEAMAIFDARTGEDFDLLVTDLMMPDGGGLVIAKRLTDKLPELKVLFVSGYSSSEAEGWEPERHRFLTKPFGSTELANAIDDLFQVKP